MRAKGGLQQFAWDTLSTLHVLYYHLMSLFAFRYRVPLWCPAKKGPRGGNIVIIRRLDMHG